MRACCRDSDSRPGARFRSHPATGDPAPRSPGLRVQSGRAPPRPSARCRRCVTRGWPRIAHAPRRSRLAPRWTERPPAGTQQPGSRTWSATRLRERRPGLQEATGFESRLALLTDSVAKCRNPKKSCRAVPSLDLSANSLS